MKAITTHSGATLAGPSVPPPSPSKEVDREPKTKTDQVLTESTNSVPPPVVQPSPNSTKLPPASISSPKIPEPNPHQHLIPYPSRLNKEKLQGKDDIQIHSFLQMFKKIHFNINFSEALAHMPKFEKMVKDLLMNKGKLLEIANTPVNENCSAVILKKLPEKLGDTGKFLIPCKFYRLESCMALADLGASINLMPLFVWKTLSLPKLSTTRMTLELATRTIAVLEGIAEDVFVRVGKFTFPFDFVVVDCEVDPRVPLILGRPFLRTAHALVYCIPGYLKGRSAPKKEILDNESLPKQVGHERKRAEASEEKVKKITEMCPTLHNKNEDIKRKMGYVLEQLAYFTCAQLPEESCMRTRNSYFPNNSTVTILRRRNRRRAPNVVEPEVHTIVEVAPMADNRTMKELLQAPTEGYGEAIGKPHTHINNFKRITSTLKFKDVPNDVIKLMMFPYSLEGAARVWYDKEPPNSILTWDDLVNKFVNQFFPPSKTTHLKNEISRFTQKFEETFGEAWERFKEMLRACPHHGFTELTQIDTFYNGLNENDQDSLNAAAGGNLLSKTTREALNIIENKSKVRYSRNKPNVSRMNTTSRESSSKTMIE
ncbi:reverse transcriptase domain-containing protein [Tanacetum coccineum]